jgi:hypothetical protein
MFARNLFIAGIAALISAIALIALDFRTQQIGKLISLKQIESAGETIGKLSVLMVLAAILYYLAREAFVTARANKLKLPTLLESKAVQFISWLRLTHPLFGLLTLSLVLLHGYLMWWVWAAGNYSLAVLSGLAAEAMLAALALTGGMIRLLPKRISLRLLHRFGGFGFVLLLVVHRLLTG